MQALGEGLQGKRSSQLKGPAAVAFHLCSMNGQLASVVGQKHEGGELTKGQVLEIYVSIEKTQAEKQHMKDFYFKMSPLQNGVCLDHGSASFP